jgi:hypothetical protein
MTVLISVHQLANMQAIQDKLERRTEVSNRKHLLEAALACMEKLDVAEEIVNSAGIGSGQPSSAIFGAGPQKVASKRRALIRYVPFICVVNIGNVRELILRILRILCWLTVRCRSFRLLRSDL